MEETIAPIMNVELSQINSKNALKFLQGMKNVINVAIRQVSPQKLQEID